MNDYIPLIYRAMPEMRVERNHWTYSGLKDGERIGLWGGDALYPPGIGACLIPELLTIEHRDLHRDGPQVERNRRFLRATERYVTEHGHEA